MGRMHRGEDGDAGGKGQKRQRRKCGRRDRDKGIRDGDRQTFRETEEDRKDTEDRDKGPDAKEDRDGAGRGSSGFRWSLLQGK